MDEGEKRYWRRLRRGRPADVPAPGPGQESVWDYPRPPRVEPARAEVRVEFSGESLAVSDRALRVLETSTPPVYYVPAEDVRMEWLEASDQRSFCEWKGQAHYWNVRIGDQVSADAAWSYPEPDFGFEALGDYVAFYPGRVDACFLGEVRVQPQEGRFYGGWITPEILGPFKGSPGTEGW